MGKLIVGLTLAIVLCPTFSEAIDYNKKDFVFGEVVYFNIGDGPCYSEGRIDENGFYDSQLIESDFVKGKFVAFEPIFIERNFKIIETDAIKAIIYYKKKDGTDWVIQRQISRRIPEQSIIMLNW